MSETRWTPGPWSYFHDTCAECRRDGVAEFIIEGPPGGHHGQFSNEADARLIAAAPDLYEALSEFIDAGKRLHVGDAMNAVEKAERALAKARGESSGGGK